MAERYETDVFRRYQAGLEALKLLDEAGFGVSDSNIEVNPGEAEFSLEVDLIVGEQTRPLQALEDESDTDLGSAFVLGLHLGLLTDTEE